MPEELSIVDDVKGLLDRRPFTPFTIVMGSGMRYEVTERHQVAVGQSVMVILPPQSTSIYLRVNQISSVEVMEPAE